MPSRAPREENSMCLLEGSELKEQALKGLVQHRCQPRSWQGFDGCPGSLYSTNVSVRSVRSMVWRIQ